MTTTHRVMFCCNDERGMFAGHVEIVDVFDHARLVCQRERPPKMKWIERASYTSVKIGRRFFLCSGRQVNVGNRFWDSATMTTTQCALLLRHLLANGWSVEEHAEDGPFAGLLSKEPSHG